MCDDIAEAPPEDVPAEPQRKTWETPALRHIATNSAEMEDAAVPDGYFTS